MVAVSVQATPSTSDAGVVDIVGSRIDGGGSFGPTALTRHVGNVFNGTIQGLTHGPWRLAAVSGPIDASVDIDVDTSGPDLVVELPGAPSYGVNGSDFIPVDGDGGTYRRDETIVVRVTSADLDLATAQLTARFSGATAAAFSDGGDCSSVTSKCRSFTVDLSRLDFPAFNGEVTFTATGEDDLTNPQRSSAPAVARVTRWQWARRIDATRSIRSVPAIGDGGRVFVATAISGGSASGTIVAVDPIAPVSADGGFQWVVSDGPIVGTIAVGRGVANEHVFFQPSTAVSTGTLKSVVASSGIADPQPCVGGGMGTANEGGVALFAENSAALTGLGVQADVSNNRGRALTAESQNCASTSPSSLQAILAPGNLAATNSRAFMVGSDGHLRVLDFNGSAVSLLPVDHSVGGVGVVTGLAMLSSTRVAGGGGPGVGRIFAFETDGGVANDAWPSGAALSTPTSGPVVGALGVYATIRSNNKVAMVRLASASGAELARTTELAGSAFTLTAAPSPVLGTNAKTYVADQNGKVFVIASGFSADAGEDWSATLPATVAGGVSASLTLDCNRRRPSSQTGVLYLATESGWLVSYLVDSPNGLDPSAPWPKYARDARNTGNFNGAPIGCP